ncbi:hypothetical protein L3556_16175 [Candidatus Synechococcus calcipolaris G9]|uniref:Uncharacterized protein n=1 Tax=Candidatus Synechococcus calcipolaris G9 TaxID=1497997 RepID=A0ABT6F3K6_9SYNE|nr:hypothetical protein [Candidatus Synechococcus calcipolaris]MDG2992456.1 hypothetical protein [Candidatus Synechococcus calcipolaris G9]
MDSPPPVPAKLFIVFLALAISLYILRGIGQLSMVPGIIFLVLSVLVIVSGVWALLTLLRQRY